jgi:hypothetical protein
MRKTLLLLIVIVLYPLVVGCSSKAESGELKTTAPIDNSSPAAKNAPVAPRDPSIQYPGQMKGKKGP